MNNEQQNNNEREEIRYHNLAADAEKSRAVFQPRINRAPINLPLLKYTTKLLHFGCCIFIFFS